MKELFDINLLSQIKGLDQKLSVSKEQLRLRHNIKESQKNKGGSKDKTGQGFKNNEEDKEKDKVKKVTDKEGHISIDITA
ncbi:MAG TPA: hypothetical protein PLM71_03170 [Syntrophorhabdaceae bacterium]|nr:hypothetical protein [Syntrophorhabdaceae bacterium]HPU29306.1 hypothetical protein [Syntrophorhabdaceae bacterium]